MKNVLMMLIVSLLLLPTMVKAQEVNLKVTLAEAETIWKAVRKLPVEEVENLMLKLRQQVAEQQNPSPKKEDNPK